MKKIIYNEKMWICLAIISILLVIPLIYLVTSNHNQVTNNQNQGKTYEEQLKISAGIFADGNYEKAIKSYTGIIKLNPKRPEAYEGRADAYVEIEDFKKASKDYEKYIKIAPEKSEVYDKLAAVLLKTGNEAGSKEILEKKDRQLAMSKPSKLPYTPSIVTEEVPKIIKTSDSLSSDTRNRRGSMTRIKFNDRDVYFDNGAIVLIVNTNKANSYYYNEEMPYYIQITDKTTKNVTSLYCKNGELVRILEADGSCFDLDTEDQSFINKHSFCVLALREYNSAKTALLSTNPELFKSKPAEQEFTATNLTDYIGQPFGKVAETWGENYRAEVFEGALFLMYTDGTNFIVPERTAIPVSHNETIIGVSSSSKEISIFNGIHPGATEEEIEVTLGMSIDVNYFMEEDCCISIVNIGDFKIIMYFEETATGYVMSAASVVARRV